MSELADAIVYVITREFGTEEFLYRISDPYWFQAFGCVLGYDWHSSGVTTVVSGVLKTVLKAERHGLVVTGGKGKASRNAPEEIEKHGEAFGLSSSKIKHLTYSSRLSAKVDNAAIQSGYPLYHHAFAVDDKGDWAVIQQGMDSRERSARRYHWLSRDLKDFVEEPHNAIVGDRVRSKVLDMTAKESRESRKISVDIAKEGPRRISYLLNSIRPSYQSLVTDWIEREDVQSGYVVNTLYMPRRINWKAMEEAYEFQPKDYEELLGMRGIGPATVRGLALISELIYGEAPSWRDPVKFTFAFGGKDGVPKPIDKVAMDRTFEVLHRAIEHADIGDKERLGAFQRMKEMVPKI